MAKENLHDRKLNACGCYFRNTHGHVRSKYNGKVKNFGRSILEFIKNDTVDAKTGGLKNKKRGYSNSKSIPSNLLLNSSKTISSYFSSVVGLPFSSLATKHAANLR